MARMREQAPGFAQAWELAVRQATGDQDAAESGFTKLILQCSLSFGRGKPCSAAAYGKGARSLIVPDAECAGEW